MLTAMVDMAPGQLVAGWRIERELARGGMGVLYLAQHPRLPRLDVLKVLPPWLAADERFRERFLREARRLGALAHPHVVVVYDSGEHDGMLYLAMQYVAGGDLRVQVADAPLPVERVLHLGGQIASALDAAHRAGIVHRDVKPENVLLADPGPFEAEHAVLTDFGISREETQASTLTATGELLLTPAYAAPEQVSGTGADGRADQYALGCMLFEMLSGRPPYGTGSPVAMLAAHLYQPVRALPTRLGLPAALDDALQRAMAKEPADRFPSCREFLHEAQQAMKVSTSPSVPVGAPATAPIPTARTPSAPWTPVPVRPGPATPPQPPSPPASLPPSLPTAPVPGGEPGRGARPGLRRALLVGVLGLVAAGAAIVAVTALRDVPGGASAKAPAVGSYAALLDRVPDVVRSGCSDRTAELNADEARYVSARARCTGALQEASAAAGARMQPVSVVYDAIRGDAAVATTYRRDVLGIGSVNHAPGDCRTRQRDSRYLDRPAHRGIYMTPGPPPLDVETWCDFAGPMYLLEPDARSAVVVQLTRQGDDGDISLQRQRYDDLAAVRPS